MSHAIGCGAVCCPSRDGVCSVLICLCILPFGGSSHFRPIHVALIEMTLPSSCGNEFVRGLNITSFPWHWKATVGLMVLEHLLWRKSGQVLRGFDKTVFEISVFGVCARELSFPEISQHLRNEILLDPPLVFVA